MKILALDTCLDACSTALWEDGAVLARLSEPMSRGHQERLAPQVAQVMAEAGVEFSALDRIAVTVGPGSFTGLRVGLAFAKGLALALDRPCLGVGVLAALAEGEPGFVAACLDAHRDQIYLQVFIDGQPIMAPDVLPLSLAAARLAELWPGGPALLTGSGAALLDGMLAGAQIRTPSAVDVVRIAQIAARARPPFAPPRPLYLRPPDAKLPGGITPP